MEAGIIERSSLSHAPHTTRLSPAAGAHPAPSPASPVRLQCRERLGGLLQYDTRDAA